MNATDHIRELETLIEPALIDLDQLLELVEADEAHDFDGECRLHDSCRSILDR